MWLSTASPIQAARELFRVSLGILALGLVANEHLTCIAVALAKAIQVTYLGPKTFPGDQPATFLCQVDPPREHLLVFLLMPNPH